MEKNGIWHEEWTIASFMVGPEQILRLKSCGDIFQELANNHANFRKVGFEHMKAEGKFWVLNRQAIRVHQMPCWGDVVKVSSWIGMMKGPFSLRHFAMHNESDELLVVASYLWTSIDTNKMRPVAFPDGDFPIVPDHISELPEAQKLKVNGELLSSETYTVRKSDLDVIGHSNNVSYLEWTENNWPIITSNTRIEANYTGESHLGNKIEIQLLQSDGHWNPIQIKNPEGQIIFKAIANPIT